MDETNMDTRANMETHKQARDAQLRHAPAMRFVGVHELVCPRTGLSTNWFVHELSVHELSDLLGVHDLASLQQG